MEEPNTRWVVWIWQCLLGVHKTQSDENKAPNENHLILTSWCSDQITWPTVGFMGNSWEGWQRDWIVSYILWSLILPPCSVRHWYSHLVQFALFTKSYFSAILFLWLFTNPSFFTMWLPNDFTVGKISLIICKCFAPDSPAEGIMTHRNIITASDIIQKKICCSIFIMVRT